MNVRETKDKLASARNLQRIIRKEIDELRKALTDAGINPDPPKLNLVPRNKKIYKYWKDGRTFIEVAKEFKLSTTRVSSICKRIEVVLEKKSGSSFRQYKDLLKYK
ncbi:MAG: hypothetical protein U0U70_08095 [Chitinophagaceae bacterium]